MWVCCCLGLPDEEGRVQILEIHTAKMREHKLVAPDVDLAELAIQTKNFTGAEIEGLVRAAQSTAMNRFIQVLQALCYALRSEVWPTELQSYVKPGCREDEPWKLFFYEKLFKYLNFIEVLQC